MDIEAVIKRENGEQIKICVDVRIDFRDSDLIYDVTIFTRSKGKKKWIHPFPEEKTREGLELRYLEIVKKSEILKATKELWKKMEPK